MINMLLRTRIIQTMDVPFSKSPNIQRMNKKKLMYYLYEFSGKCVNSFLIATILVRFSFISLFSFCWSWYTLLNKQNCIFIVSIGVFADAKIVCKYDDGNWKMKKKSKCEIDVNGARCQRWKISYLDQSIIAKNY